MQFLVYNVKKTKRVRILLVKGGLAQTTLHFLVWLVIIAD